MSLRMLGLTACFALAANAFMIPSTISLPQLNDKVSGWPSLDITRLVDVSSRSRIAKLPCTGCALPIEGKPDAWLTDVPNSLVFDIAVSDDGKTVVLNGERIYPVDHAVQLKAPQVLSSVPDKDLYTSLDSFATTPRRLDFALGSRTVEAADGTDAQLIDIDLRVFGIDGSSGDLGALSIRLLRDTDGTISIADVENVPVRGGPKPKPEHSSDDTIETLPIGKSMQKLPAICNGSASFVCRFFDNVEDRITSMRDRLSAHGRPSRRPCPGKMGLPRYSVKGGAPKFMAWKYGPKPPHMQGVPEPHLDGNHVHDMMMHHDSDGHGPRHHHQGSYIVHHLARGLRHLFFGFVVPVLIGVAAGMTASALGMIVGTFVAWAWIKFVRGGRRNDLPQIIIVDTEDFTGSDACEKVGLMAEPATEHSETAPPVYAEKE